jgi:hypothetical protein
VRGGETYEAGKPDAARSALQATEQKCIWLPKEQSTDVPLNKGDWLSLHKDLVEKQFFPDLRSNIENISDVSAQGKSTFDRISMPLPPVETREIVKTATTSSTSRDAVLAGSGALLVLLARWLRELVTSRRKSTTNFGAAPKEESSNDIWVVGQWTDK